LNDEFKGYVTAAETLDVRLCKARTKLSKRVRRFSQTGRGNFQIADKRSYSRALLFASGSRNG